MKAMIFAAGLGTRLKPLTDTMPKALVPVCGQPLLYHVICKLRDAGYDELVINVHHFPDQIRKYLEENDFGVQISISDESEALLETGGGIRHAKDLLLPSDEPFLVHNVDIISNLDISWFRKQMPRHALATLLVSKRKTKRYLLFDDNMRLVGWQNTETGEYKSAYLNFFRPEDCRRYAFAGIHNISPAIFDAFDKENVPDRFPIMDFYLSACVEYPIYGVVDHDLTLVDVGKFDTLPEAESICRELLPTARPPFAKIGK